MSEIADFRKALSEAGQPWSRRGIRVIGAGVVALLAVNIAAMLTNRIPFAAYVFVAALGVIAVGWVMMIIAVLKRRRWAKAHPIADIPLDPASLTGAS